MTRTALRLALAVAGPLALAGPLSRPASAQQVERRGSSDVALDRRLDRLLQADPLVVTRDTMVQAGDTIRRPVLLLDATIVLEGAILGDLVMVQAGAFLRPRSSVGGDVVNIAGGLYRSELASIGGAIIDLPTAPYRVVREADRLIIEATATASRLSLDGVMGLHIPTYDRVNGVTAVWGAGYRLPRLGGVTPRLHGRIGWHTQRGDPTHGVGLTLDWVGHTLAVGHERVPDTNERWIRGDLQNSLNYLWSGRDYRDYHELERSWVGLSRAFGDAQKSFFAVLGARFQVEDSRSLEGGAPWHIWRRDVRDNPPVDDGRITSALGDLRIRWNGLLTAFDGTLTYERGLPTMDGESEFHRVVADAEWAMAALANHTLEIEVHAQAVPGGGALPRQRWSFIGGSGTLQTLPFAAFHGDRVVFVETKYVIPVSERVALPVLGAPDLHLIHAAGMAWQEREDGALRQEIGLRLQFFGLYLRYMIEPTDPSNGDFDLGISLRFGRGHSWER